MSELLSVVDALAAIDVHAMSEPALLVATEELLTARDRLDGVLARFLQGVDTRSVTDNECGRTTRSWLVEAAHQSPAEAGRKVAVARGSAYQCREVRVRSGADEDAESAANRIYDPLGHPDHHV